MKAVIHKVMNHPELLTKPPVFIDVGASGALFPQWTLMVPNSICVAFDADSRDFSVTESENSGWKKLYLMNRLVAEHSCDEVDYYLTKSPYCSSSLRPDNEALKPWGFRQLFEIENVVKIPAVSLCEALTALGVDYIDWFKTDSQGTDLRIFGSLPKTIVEKILAAEFEPGIIDAYIGEDKLYHLLAYMDKLPFWVSHMNIQGAHRIDQYDLSTFDDAERPQICRNLKIAPGWCEISYINTLCSEVMTCREYLLGWVFSTIKEEHAFALGLARMGSEKFKDSLFDELYGVSRKSLLRRKPGFIGRAAVNLSRMLTGRV